MDLVLYTQETHRERVIVGWVFEPSCMEVESKGSTILKIMSVEIDRQHAVNFFSW